MKLSHSETPAPLSWWVGAVLSGPVPPGSQSAGARPLVPVELGCVGSRAPVQLGSASSPGRGAGPSL